MGYTSGRHSARTPSPLFHHSPPHGGAWAHDMHGTDQHGAPADDADMLSFPMSLDDERPLSAYDRGDEAYTFTPPVTRKTAR
jgi:hypothetical protein